MNSELHGARSPLDPKLDTRIWKQLDWEQTAAACTLHRNAAVVFGIVRDTGWDPIDVKFETRVINRWYATCGDDCPKTLELLRGGSFSSRDKRDRVRGGTAKKLFLTCLTEYNRIRDELLNERITKEVSSDIIKRSLKPEKNPEWVYPYTVNRGERTS
jgi:hypothetical protein